MPRLLLLGGTGFVGRSVCEQLAQGTDAGWQVTVPSRGRGATPPAGATVVAADIHDEATLARLLDGADAVVNLVAILHGNAAEFRRTHVELPRTLVGACRSAGVRRIVHVSALGVDSAVPSLYLRSKAEGEAVIRDAGLDATVLRPSVIFGARDRFLNLFATLQRFAPVMPLAGAGARFQPVWVEDVAAAIVACLARQTTIGQVIECAGTATFTLAELVRLAGKASGHPRPVIPLPDAIGRLQAGMMEHLPGATLMSRDNLDSMRTPNVASGRLPGLESLGIRASALEDVAPGYLAAARR